MKTHLPYKIIAVDFDGCLCKNCYPGIGKPNMRAIKKLIRLRATGTKIILWTCREGNRLLEAVRWCNEYGLYFDAINGNLPAMSLLYGNDTRKVGADEYWDDKGRRVRA